MIRLTKINKTNDHQLPQFLFNSSIDDFALEDFKFKEGAPESENLQQRTWANYRDETVWIEWKEISTRSSFRPDHMQVQCRIGLLTDLLHSDKPVCIASIP